MTLHDPSISPKYVDYHGFGVSQDITATYPGGAKYTLDVGHLSLYGGSQTISWTSTNGSSITYNRTLPDIYAYGYIPSPSYGLHIGSVEPNITASLILGGYDSSRVLSPPITSTTDYLTLTDIILKFSRGGFALQNATSSGRITNLLRANGSTLQVHPRPGVPYIYLLRQTCDAIAAHLPVTYNAAFNLYFWNTDSPSYHSIITSPHYLSFSFAGKGSIFRARLMMRIRIRVLRLGMRFCRRRCWGGQLGDAAPISRTSSRPGLLTRQPSDDSSRRYEYSSRHEPAGLGQYVGGHAYAAA